MTTATMNNTGNRRVTTIALAVGGLVLGCATAAGLLVATGNSPGVARGTVVSQRDRAFSPAMVTVRVGTPLTIVNDDGRNIHHAYVDQEDFKYDSGDQEPGDKTVISFPAEGKYTVMCGIHPKMRMAVVVRP